jgi:choline dehydrogenase-like flavoprotein
LGTAFISNTHIDYSAKVTKVLFNQTEGGLLATGIQFSVNATEYEVLASKEVVLSAGSVQTPQILELSGKWLRTPACLGFRVNGGDASQG